MGVSLTWPIFDEPAQNVGQGLDLPYAPVYTAGVPTYADVAPPLLDVPRSGGYAAPIIAVPADAYAPRLTPNTGGRVLGTTGTSPVVQPNGAAPCGCNGNGSLGLPWWAWALVAIGVVAIFRRVT